MTTPGDQQLSIVRALCGERFKTPLTAQEVTVFAPTNIALCKYWGKRDVALNLPAMSSLSVTLPNRGVTTSLALQDSSL